MARATRTWRGLAALGVVGVLTLGGCGLFEGTEDADEQPEQQQEQEGDALRTASDDLTEGAGEDAEPVPMQDELPVVASRTATMDGEPIEVELNGVTVEGGVMSVLLTVRNTGDGPAQISQSFDDGLQNEVAGGGSAVDNVFTADGLTVLDGTNQKVHLVARDSDGRCVCSAALQLVRLEPEQQVVLSSTFAAVPDDVETVTVNVPRAGAFADVAVTR